jgi:DNA helicase-2/ATP-dependent DNA helicase PcrA
MIGDPVEDWKRARHLLEEIKDLNELFREARMVRLFGARDALATGLAAVWLSSGNYADAASLVKEILDQERLVASDRDPRGCMLMTIHKSKGKEFDAVVLVEGAYQSQFFDRDREKFPFERSRRLFRVAMTRARSMVTIIRPKNAPPLVEEE